MVGILFTNFFALFGAFGLSSTSGLLSERSGTVNIAIDGQMIVGGLIWALLVTGPMAAMGPIAPLLALIPAGLGAMMYSLLLSLGTVTLHADNVVVGTALNMIAPALSMLIIFMIFGQSSMSTPIQNAFSAGWAGSIDTTAIWFTIITVGTMAATWLVLNKTSLGLRLKTSGENPYSLASAGISVARTRYIANLVGGFYSGMAGAMAVLTMVGFSGSVNGIGYIALAVLIFGRWTVLGNALGTVILAFAMALGRTWMQSSDLLAIVPAELFEILPFLIPLLVLIGTKMFYKDKGYGGAPKAAGLPFKKDAR